MSTSPARKEPPANIRPPQLDELFELAAWWHESPEAVLCPVAVRPEDLPTTARALLVHRDHMTTRLQDHYRSPLVLHVHDAETRNGRYEREITLALADVGTVVEYGIVRIELSLIADAVRLEILAQQAPLGNILLRHNVMRRVEPTGYLQFGARSALLAYFKDRRVVTAYGRTGVIYCDERPAIRVLEVVRGEAPAARDAAKRID